jgi:hypothetical protein
MYGTGALAGYSKQYPFDRFGTEWVGQGLDIATRG